MTDLSSDDRDVIICALLNKLGGVVSLRATEFQLGNVHTRLTQLPTGTLHLELIATPAVTSADMPLPSTTDSDTLMHLGG